MKRAVVTGASSGIGLATVRRLLGRGVQVVAVDLSTLKDDSLAGMVENGQLVQLNADISDPEGRQKVVESAGEIDYLINSAGILRLTPIEYVTEDEWKSVHSVNAEALFFFIQALAPRIRAGGSIVNVSSIVAMLPRPEQAAYASSKAAVLSITRAFAASLGHRSIRVNAICPGIIDTPMQATIAAFRKLANAKDIEQWNAERASLVPLGRLGTAEDCAGAINFFLSDDAAYVTGQVLGINGGLLMG